MADFLQFVHANSQPNGHHHLSKEKKNYDEKAHSSLVHKFNRVQRELGKGTFGPTARKVLFILA